MKILLIDDHPLILAALKSVIPSVREGAILISAECAQVAREALSVHSPFDLILLDLQLGDVNGFELLADIRRGFPEVSVVVISASDRSVDIMRSIEMGAMGFVPKRASNAQLLAALDLVMSGGIYVPPITMRSEGVSRFDSRCNDGSAFERDVALGSVAPPTLESYGLTPRQTEVLALLLRGQSNKQIARELNLSVETIKDHVAAVLRALNVHSRTQAVLAVSKISNADILRSKYISEPQPMSRS